MLSLVLGQAARQAAIEDAKQRLGPASPAEKKPLAEKKPPAEKKQPKKPVFDEPPAPPPRREVSTKVGDWKVRGCEFHEHKQCVQSAPALKSVMWEVDGRSDALKCAADGVWHWAGEEEDNAVRCLPVPLQAGE